MKTIQHKFVEFIPNQVEQDVLYISVEYKTAVHLCICGCGNKVVTPLSPTDWELRFDGKTVSLSPSIGNWNFECKSHYWIKKGKVEWSGSWSDNQIRNGREADEVAKKEYYASEPEKKILARVKKKKGFWSRILEIFTL